MKKVKLSKSIKKNIIIIESYYKKKNKKLNISEKRHRSTFVCLQNAFNSHSTSINRCHYMYVQVELCVECGCVRVRQINVCTNQSIKRKYSCLAWLYSTLLILRWCVCVRAVVFVAVATPRCAITPKTVLFYICMPSTFIFSSASMT